MPLHSFPGIELHPAKRPLAWVGRTFGRDPATRYHLVRVRHADIWPPSITMEPSVSDRKELDERDTVRDLAGKPKDTLRGLNEGAPGADEPPPSSGARSVVIVSAPDSTRPPVDTAAPKRNTLPKGGPGEAPAAPASPSKKNSVPRLLAGSVTQPPTWAARKAERVPDAAEADAVAEEAVAIPTRSPLRGLVIAAAIAAAVVVGWFVLRSPAASPVEAPGPTAPAATAAAVATPTPAPTLVPAPAASESPPLPLTAPNSATTRPAAAPPAGTAPKPSAAPPTHVTPPAAPSTATSAAPKPTSSDPFSRPF